MFRVLPHYALLLFALLVSLRWLGACWGPNVMEGAAILTSASDWRNSPAEPRASRSRPEHGICSNSNSSYAAGISTIWVFLSGS